MNNDAIIELKEKLGVVSDTLYAGEVTKGIADMGMIIPDLTTLADSISDEELRQRLLNDVLVPALEAMEGRDGLLLADVISYELMDILEEM